MRQTNQVIAVSSNTAQDIQKFLTIPPQQITVALNGVDPHFRVLLPETIAPLRQQYTASPETICLLHVGGTHQRKNILTVLRVIERLRTQGVPVCLWKTGSQFVTEQKKFIQDHQLEQHIIHFGNPDQDTLVSLYNAADILLSPSLYEGFGLTIVEAMACGTPVITSNVSSLPEVAGDAAILLEPTDVEGIVSAVIHLKQDSARYHSLSNRGKMRAESLNWKKTTESVARVYEKL